VPCLSLSYRWSCGTKKWARTNIEKKENEIYRLKKRFFFLQFEKIAPPFFLEIEGTTESFHAIQQFGKEYKRLKLRMP
jgi:hypothetical protein